MEISSDEEIIEITSSPGSKGKARVSRTNKPAGRPKQYVIRPNRNGAFRATSNKMSKKPPSASEIIVLSDDESHSVVQTRTSQKPSSGTSNSRVMMLQRHTKKPRTSSEPYVSARQ